MACKSTKSRPNKTGPFRQTQLLISNSVTQETSWSLLCLLISFQICDIKESCRQRIQTIAIPTKCTRHLVLRKRHAQKECALKKATLGTFSTQKSDWQRIRGTKTGIKKDDHEVGRTGFMYQHRYFFPTKIRSRVLMGSRRQVSLPSSSESEFMC